MISFYLHYILAFFGSSTVAELLFLSMHLAEWPSHIKHDVSCSPKHCTKSFDLNVWVNIPFSEEKFQSGNFTSAHSLDFNIFWTSGIGTKITVVKLYNVFIFSRTFGKGLSVWVINTFFSFFHFTLIRLTTELERDFIFFIPSFVMCEFDCLTNFLICCTPCKNFQFQYSWSTIK